MFKKLLFILISGFALAGISIFIANAHFVLSANLTQDTPFQIELKPIRVGVLPGNLSRTEVILSWCGVAMDLAVLLGVVLLLLGIFSKSRRKTYLAISLCSLSTRIIWFAIVSTPSGFASLNALLGDTSGYHLYADRASHQGQYDDAIFWYSKGIEMLSSDDRIQYRQYLHRARADAYGNLGQYQKQAADYKIALDLDPNDTRTSFCYAVVLMNLGRYQSAVDYCEKIIKAFNEEKPTTLKDVIGPTAVVSNFMQSEIAETYLVRAFSYGKLGNYQQELVDCNEAIRISSKYELPYQSELAYAIRALAFQSLGKMSNALEDCNKAIQLDSARSVNYESSLEIMPENAGVYGLRGSVYVNMKQYKSAVEDLNKAIAAAPKYAWAYHERGIAFSKLGKDSLAANDQQKAKELGL